MSLRNFKFKIIVCLFVIIILSMIYDPTNSRYTSIQNYTKTSYQKLNDDPTKIKTSKISTPIHINNNWSDAFIAGKCTGDGSYSNPYIIRDLDIDGNQDKSCIIIENSQDYFIVENCTLYNAGEISGYGAYMAGIKLNNAQNGTVRNNTCFANLDAGIAVVNCKNITINENNINDSGFRGLILEDSCNITINSNAFLRQGVVGIDCKSSSNVSIFNNNLEDNEYGGIDVSDDCYNFTISENYFLNNELGLSESYNFIILNNTFINCIIEFYGDYEYIPSLIVDIENKINGFPIYQYNNEVNLNIENFTYVGRPSQIILDNCNNSIINNLNFSYGEGGISIFNSNDIIIRTCNLTDNEEGGILLSSVFNFTIEKNVLYNNEGIHSWGYCHNSTFIDNEIIYTDSGIEFSHTAHYNNISNNNISFTDGTGINFELYGDFNVIINNTLINNDDHGISVDGKGNILLKNNMTNCGIQIDAPSRDYAGSQIIDFSNEINGNPIYYYGDKECLKPINFTSAGTPGQILLGNCSHSVLSGFTISQSSVGISLLYCDNNTISKNTLSENMVCGLSLYHSVNNTVFDNDLNYNDDYGIYLYDYSNINNISYNRIISSGFSGVYLDENCNNNTILHNEIRNCDSSGIRLRYHSNNNTMSYNQVDNNYEGIRVYYHCYDNIISFNDIKNNEDDGIEIRECNNTLVLGNTIHYNGHGYIYNFYYGMHYYNGYGVNIVESFNNTVTENEFLGNKNTIIEVDCNYNNIFNNYYLTPPPADKGDDDDDDDEAISVIHGYNISILFVIIIAMAILIIKSRIKLLE